MKKTFKTLALMLLTALFVSSCADVPAPYTLPNSKSETEGNSGTTIEPAGEGTLASPYNVAAIVAKIKDMEAGVESTEEYYIKGKVINVKTDEATIKQYGNHTFEMVDEGNNSTVFTAFQVYGPGKKKFTAVDDIKVGDEVVVCGKVVNYKGNTPETVGKGAAYVVSINSADSGDSQEEGKVITCAQAVELTNALADGGVSTESYTITGYITEVIGSVSRDQQTFWMADTKDGGRVFEAYWANLPEGVSEFKAGMKVKITGQLMKYVNNSGVVTPEVKNADVVILEDGAGEPVITPEGTDVTCAQAVELTNALADGGISTETYTVTGYITEVIGSVSRDQQTFWMADTKDGGRVFEAYWANLPEGVSEFKAGMKVKITGQLMKYVKNGAVTPEIKNADVVILEDGDNEPVITPEGTEVTCAQAVELTNALADGGVSTDTYSVTGYITEVLGSVSRDQQSFWMADTKDGGRVFEAYWANLPAGVSEFKVGSKVKITGQLMKYVKNGAVTPEIKNADVVILEEGDGGQGEDPTPGPGGDTVSDLVNGGFETWVSDSEPTGWKSASSASSATLSKSSDAHSGSFACKVLAPGTQNKRLATQEITLAAGSYTFSFYAKCTTADKCQTKGGYVHVNDDGSITDSYQYAKTYVDINNNGWTLVSYDFELTTATKLCLLVMNPKNSSYSVSQDILIDDATLVKK
ncbi:MAG: carbohydrate binding domain-containing protein [Bacteroidaceae bacterium]|nr:carbohydrate binding domain-containing protein [Bacteroidaceae bacterium]